MRRTSTTGLQLAKLFVELLEHVVDRLTPERAAIVYKDNDVLSIQCAYGMDRSPTLATSELSIGLVSSAMREQQTICALDAQQDPELSARVSVLLAGIRSVLCVPILHPSGLSIGAIYVDDRVNADLFKEAEATWLTECAEETGHAVTALCSKASKAQVPVPREPGPDEYLRWDGVRAVGLEAFREGDFQRAEASLLEAWQMAQDWGYGEPLCLTLNELAECYRAMGDLDRARELLEQTLEALEQFGQAGSIESIPLLNNLASVYRATGELSRAQALFTYCVDILEGSPLEQRQRLPQVLCNLAVIHQDRNDAETATMLCRKALDAAQTIWGADHPVTHRCRNKLNAMCAGCHEQAVTVALNRPYEQPLQVMAG